MKTTDIARRAAALAGVLFGLSGVPAQAVTLFVQPSGTYQFGTGSGVYLGHTVIASTNMNALEAGGSFRAHCMSPDTGDITGARSLPASGLIGPQQLYVTIPAQLPALRNMPGFFNVPRGANLMCSYDWTAYSRESSYSVGIPGVSTPVGGGQMSDSGSRTFWMRKPGTATGGDDACIP